VRVSCVRALVPLSRPSRACAPVQDLVPRPPVSVMGPFRFPERPPTVNPMTDTVGDRVIQLVWRAHIDRFPLGEPVA